MIYRRIYTMIACFCMTTLNFYAHQNYQDEDRFDVMSDFAYPVLEVEAMRHNVAQGLYFLQESVHGSHDSRRALNFLEQADSKSITRDALNQDDRETLQNLLDQLNGLINNLENHDEYRSDLSNVCSNLQDKL